MEPLSTTVAAIVGLICNFRQELGARRDATHKDFLEWLANHRHNELKELISQTHHLHAEIDGLLRAEQSQVLLQVERANTVLVDILARLDEFKGIVTAIRPSGHLSDQAISILRQLLQSGFPEVGLLKYIGGFRLSCFGYGRTGPTMELSEPMYAEDDLNILAELDLLRCRVAPRGEHFFGITRAAADLIKAIDGRLPDTQQHAGG